jgi:hypothetical protein
MPDRPEADVRRPQLVQVKRKHLLWRRQFVHVVQVLLKQRVHLRAAEIIEFYLHVMD